MERHQEEKTRSTESGLSDEQVLMWPTSRSLGARGWEPSRNPDRAERDFAQEAIRRSGD
jgi:hypothetical protein